MQLPMIGTMEIDHGKREKKILLPWNRKCHFNPSSFSLLVYENGNHSSYQDDDECDSSAHPRKISLDEDILPPAMPIDEDDDEPGMSQRK